MAVLLYFGKQQFQGISGIAQDSDIDLYIFVNFGGVYFKVDDPGLFGVGIEVARYTVVKTHPNGNQQVAFVGQDVGAVVSVHPHHAHIEGVVCIHGRQSQDGPCCRDPRFFHEGFQLLFRLPEDHALPVDDIGFFGRVDQCCRSINGFGVRLRVRVITAYGIAGLVAKIQFIELGIFGDIDQYRTGAPGPGYVKGFCHDLRDL